ncbi:arabinofuranosidase catalytic domain-containing protein [Sphaerisporangium sp. B11E5]|uniref:arabinofuranosidase catalytic domain-containing protein n=1 Tax=Sphaerisporangium sp. B11E5 TaxID=3153563 RepID=UPI00325DAFE8
MIERGGMMPPGSLRKILAIDASASIALPRPAGAADAAAQDPFRAGTTCLISVIHDRSGLTQAPGGTTDAGTMRRWTYTSGKVYGDRCLDTYGQGTANGTQAIIWDCDGQAGQERSLRS